jgi:epoxide hydrolase-like predicted phosphatase
MYNRVMIKAVLFDYGGVLTEDGKSGSIAKIFARIYGIDAPDVRFGPSIEQILRGNISEEDFYSEMDRLNPSKSQANSTLFKKYEETSFTTKCEPVYSLAKKLRAHGIKTGILSNIFPMSARMLREHGNYDGFDPVVLSCEAGVLKPRPEFYDIALAALQLRPNEVLFIDDQAVCLGPAQKLGMYTVLAESPEQIVRDVIKLLKIENSLDLDTGT